MPYIDSRQENNEPIKLYYEVHGEGHPLVFVAGFGADHFVWQGVVDEFSKRYQVILFDNRGAGKSSFPFVHLNFLLSTAERVLNAEPCHRRHFRQWQFTIGSSSPST